MSIWTKGIKTMLKKMGILCEASLANECVEFYAVFDRQNVLETADGMQVIIEGSVLTVEKSVADKLVRNTTIKSGEWDDEKTFYVREVLYQDDGELARVSIVEKPV